MPCQALRKLIVGYSLIIQHVYHWSLNTNYPAASLTVGVFFDRLPLRPAVLGR